MEQPKIYYCPFCGERHPIALPYQEGPTSLARCRRCHAVFSCTVISWDRKPDDDERKPRS